MTPPTLTTIAEHRAALAAARDRVRALEVEQGRMWRWLAEHDGVAITAIARMSGVTPGAVSHWLRRHRG